MGKSKSKKIDSGLNKKTEKAIGLCFRCEWRARFVEEKDRPRFECGEINKAVHSCYMYCPVKPIVLNIDKGDIRPFPAPIFISARCHGVGIADFVLSAKITRGKKRSEHKYIKYWIPEEETEKKEQVNDGIKRRAE